MFFQEAEGSAFTYFGNCILMRNTECEQPAASSHTYNAVSIWPVL